MPSFHRPGFDAAVAQFRLTASTVPAYAQFLRDAGIEADDVVTPGDFERVPPMTKENYFHRYPRRELLTGGTARAAGFWSYSSGTTGRPSYWPRNRMSRTQGAGLHRRILRQFRAHERSTLVVVSFALGNWIGGTYTVSCLEELAAQGFPISIITPGQDVDTVRADIATLGPEYEQVVLVGYPPFVRDVLDGADPRVLDLDLKILMAGEMLSEYGRDRLLRLIGKPERPADTCLIYGAADAGLIGHETATSIAVRRLATEDGSLRRRLFVTDVPPTFVEFDSGYRYIETDDDGALLLTVAGPVPLVRYRINDYGSMVTAARLAAVLRAAGHDLRVRTSSPGSAFLVLDGRPDIAATFHAVKIPLDSIRAALVDPRIGECLTGKVLVSTDADGDRDELRLRVELRAGLLPGPGMASRVARVVDETLAKLSTEYREMRRARGDAADTSVTVLPHGHREFAYATKLPGLRRAG